MPFARGTVRREQTFALTAPDGKSLPLQQWPLAYWPDGSLKWTGHALATDAALAAPLTIAPGEPAAPAAPLKVTRSDDFIEIANGQVLWRLSTKISALIDSIADLRRGSALFDGFIAKPMSPTDLVRRVAAYLQLLGRRQRAPRTVTARRGAQEQTRAPSRA